MKCKISAIFITILMLTMVFTSCFFLTDNVKATDTISNVEVSVGAVNAVIHFNVTNRLQRTYINWSTNSDMSSSHQTYTFPDNVSYWALDDILGTSHTERYQIVRGLEPDTTYYYQIFSNNTNMSYGNFTTKTRFTDVWIDEFFDDYLWSGNNSIKLVQADGTVEGPLVATEGNFTSNYYTVIYMNNTFRCWGAERDSNGEVFGCSTCERAAGCYAWYYSESINGTNFTINTATDAATPRHISGLFI
jgi:hypothetical protein